MRLDRSPFLICKMSVYSFSLKRNLLESFEINRISLQWMSSSIQQIMFVVFHLLLPLNKPWYLIVKPVFQLTLCIYFGKINKLNKLKRRDTFNFLKSKKYAVYFLQDTHFTNNEENYIRFLWGYECYFSNFSSQSRGVAILLNNNFEFKLHNTKIDENGNKIILDITIEGFRLSGRTKLLQINFDR